MTSSTLLFNPTRLDDEALFKTFVGRDALAERLVRDLAADADGETSRHWVIVGPRGYGKSHLGEVVARRIEREHGFAVARLPEEHYQVATLADFLEQVVVRLAPGEPSPFRDEPDPDRVVELALDHLRRSEGPTLVVLENLGDFLAKLKKKELHRLREILMRDAPFVVLATALAPVGVRESDVFHDFFHPLALDELSGPEVRELVSRRLELDRDAELLEQRERLLGRAEALRTFSGGNPRLVLALYTLLREGLGEALYTDLLNLLDRVTPYYQARLADLSTQESRLLTEMSVAEGPLTPAELGRRLRWKTNAVTAVLSRLGDARLVVPTARPDKRSRYYEVVDRMFRIWIQMREDRSARKTLRFLADFLQTWFEGRSDEAWTLARKLRDAYWTAAIAGDEGRTGTMIRTLEHLLGALGEGGESVAEVLDTGDTEPGHTEAELLALERKFEQTRDPEEREALALRIIEGWEGRRVVGRGAPVLDALGESGSWRTEIWRVVFDAELRDPTSGASVREGVLEQAMRAYLAPNAGECGARRRKWAMFRLQFDLAPELDVPGVTADHANAWLQWLGSRDRILTPLHAHERGQGPAIGVIAIVLYAARCAEVPGRDAVVAAIDLIADHHILGLVGCMTAWHLLAGPHGLDAAQRIQQRLPDWDWLRQTLGTLGGLTAYAHLRDVGFIEDVEPWRTALLVRDANDPDAAMAALHPEMRDAVHLLLEPKRPTA